MEGGRREGGDVPVVEVKRVGVGMDVDERVGLTVDEAADLEGGREGGRGQEKMSGARA
mgnify:CR=1 FL=1|jgi:hypothetical protein